MIILGGLFFKQLKRNVVMGLLHQKKAKTWPYHGQKVIYGQSFAVTLKLHCMLIDV